MMASIKAFWILGAKPSPPTFTSDCTYMIEIAFFGLYIFVFNCKYSKENPHLQYDVDVFPTRGFHGGRECG